MNKILFETGLLISFFCFNLYSCYSNGEQKVINNMAKIDSVKAAIHNTIVWAKNKDFDLLYSVIANDSNYLEVDPNPGITRGFAQFKKKEAFWGSNDFKAIRYDIRDLTINFSEKGDVAWFYCVLDDINE